MTANSADLQLDPLWSEEKRRAKFDELLAEFRKLTALQAGEDAAVDASIHRGGAPPGRDTVIEDRLWRLARCFLQAQHSDTFLGSPKDVALWLQLRIEDALSGFSSPSFPPRPKGRTASETRRLLEQWAAEFIQLADDDKIELPLTIPDPGDDGKTIRVRQAETLVRHLYGVDRALVTRWQQKHQKLLDEQKALKLPPGGKFGYNLTRLYGDLSDQRRSEIAIRSLEDWGRQHRNLRAKGF